MTLIEKSKIFWNTLPRGQKWFAVAVVIGFILFNLSGWITASFSEWKHRRFLEQVAEKDKKVEKNLAERDKFKVEADKLKIENSLLRQQQEATAEVLRANNKKLEGDAEKLKLINEERQKKYEEINRDVDVTVRRCTVCADYARAGFKLSAEFCGQCDRK